MAYKVLVIYPSGTEEYEDEVFDTYEKARTYGESICECFIAGGELLKSLNVDYIEGNAEFKVVEV